MLTSGARKATPPVEPWNVAPPNARTSSEAAAPVGAGAVATTASSIARTATARTACRHHTCVVATRLYLRAAPCARLVAARHAHPTAIWMQLLARAISAVLVVSAVLVAP